MLKKGDFNEVVEPRYTYGFEIVDDVTGDITIEYIKSDEELTAQQIESHHVGILERSVKEREDLTKKDK